MYKTIQQYKDKEFRGMDVSLAISLFEYGFAYLEREKDFVFVNRAEVGFFCEDTFEKGKEVKDLISWASDEDLKYFLSFVGLSFEDFSTLPIPQQIDSLVGYFGRENIFGAAGLSFEIYE